MKKLVILFSFIVIFCVFAGCMGNYPVSNPIIGKWVADDDAITFFENGKVSEKWLGGGIWEKYDDTHYAITTACTSSFCSGADVTRVYIYDPKSDTLTLEGYKITVYKRVNTQTTVPVPPPPTSSISTPKNVVTSPELSHAGWIWSRDHWDGWQHSTSWSGREAGPNSEFGPVMVGDHGEYGTDTQLYGGSTESSVWQTFNEPSGAGWNTIEFTGMLTPTDTPAKRWMTIEVNDQEIFKGSASQNPPGNGVTFIIKRSFIQSPSVKVKISNGQNSAFGGRFAMYYYSVKLSREN